MIEMSEIIENNYFKILHNLFYLLLILNNVYIEKVKIHSIYSIDNITILEE